MNRIVYKISKDTPVMKSSGENKNTMDSVETSVLKMLCEKGKISEKICHSAISLVKRGEG